LGVSAFTSSGMGDSYPYSGFRLTLRQSRCKGFKTL